MNRFYISAGSNIKPEKNIPACLKTLKTAFPSARFSTIYETDPVGPAGNLKFWNLAVQIETPLEREKVFHKLREIEESLGRKREGDKFAPRTIDLDLLPQKDYQRFAFIMIPLAEIAPEEKDVETGKTFRELAGPLKKEAESFRKIDLR